MTELVEPVFTGGENDGNRIPLVPRLHATTSVWLEPLSKLRITGTYQYFSRQYEGGDYPNQQQQIDPYGLVGLRIDVTCSRHVKLYFKVDNLLDETYASSAYLGGYYPGSGRAFYTGITMEF
jgi:outer membrane receptor protein involved in Fe transport